MSLIYYYIDDDPISQIEEIAKGLSVYQERLFVKAYQPKKWDGILEFLETEQNNFHGLLLDWGLTRKNESGEDPNFTVEALAQQIRREITEAKKIKKDFPIILCSAQYNFKRIYNKELSSHDLFDLVYEKDSFSDELGKVVNELHALAEGYSLLQKIINYTEIEESIQRILSIDKSYIDYRAFEYLRILLAGRKPIHEISRFLLSKVVLPNGILIDENILAARLGVDLSYKQDEDWSKLLLIIESTKYSGVLGEGWSRWWMTLLSEWWESTFSNSISNLTGPEKVNLLNEQFGIKLIPVSLSSYNKNLRFWTVCQESKVPISLEDGVLINTLIDKSSWEDDRYYSISVALEKDIVDIHSLERERIEKLKNLLSKKRS